MDSHVYWRKPKPWKWRDHTPDLDARAEEFNQPVLRVSQKDIVVGTDGFVPKYGALCAQLEEAATPKKRSTEEETIGLALTHSPRGYTTVDASAARARHKNRDERVRIKIPEELQNGRHGVDGRDGNHGTYHGPYGYGSRGGDGTAGTDATAAAPGKSAQSRTFTLTGSAEKLGGLRNSPINLPAEGCGHVLIIRRQHSFRQ